MTDFRCLNVYPGLKPLIAELKDTVCICQLEGKNSNKFVITVAIVTVRQIRVANLSKKSRLYGKMYFY